MRPADLHQHLVACGVANRVVDQLEPVQVEEQHRERATTLAHAGDRGVEPFQQLRPVGQPGQRIVPRLVGEPLLGADALADLRAQLAIGAGQLVGA